MPQIIPIKDLKNTSEISDMCHKTEEPIYVTKNGYGDMVIMSMEMRQTKLEKSSTQVKQRPIQLKMSFLNLKNLMNHLEEILISYDLGMLQQDEQAIFPLGSSQGKPKLLKKLTD